MDTLEASAYNQNTITPEIDLSQIPIDIHSNVEPADRKSSFDVIYDAIEEEKSQPTSHEKSVQKKADAVDCFVQTKESLRHITETRITEKQNTSSDNTEDDDSYKKIPVQQLINTFEKQMRSIIKQQINEKIQVKVEENVKNSQVGKLFINREQFGTDHITSKSNKTETTSETVSTTAASNEFSIKLNDSIDTVNIFDSQQRQQSDDYDRVRQQSENLTTNQTQWSAYDTTSTNNRLNESIEYNSSDKVTASFDNVESSLGGKINHCIFICRFASFPFIRDSPNITQCVDLPTNEMHNIYSKTNKQQQTNKETFS